MNEVETLEMTAEVVAQGSVVVDIEKLVLKIYELLDEIVFDMCFVGAHRLAVLC